MKQKWTERIKNAFTSDVPAEYTEAFALDWANKNNFRFSVLPYFNILTQLVCFVIYLYIYPATFPDKPRLDPTMFTLLSLVYIGVNILFVVAFTRMRGRSEQPGYVRDSLRLTAAFMVCYVLLESIETIMEVEISGNIYRFLATFFVAAYLPQLRRWQKTALLFLFALAVEIGFALLISQGYPTSNRFQEIVGVFFVACVFLINISYTSNVRTFTLQQSLIRTNDKLRETNDKLGEANAQLEHLAVIDPLTQLSNRRAFDQYMQLIWKESSRAQGYVTIIMVDVDNFKQFNDRYGHQAGDDCLAAIAKTFRELFCRETDMAARYGGEEFIVLIAHARPDDAFVLAEKMCKNVEALHIPDASGEAGAFVTISAGIASEIPQKDERYETLIKKADDALYEAKTNGKNRVVRAKA